MPINETLLREFSYNRYFLETGTWHGDGVRAALRAGFRDIRSVELSPQLYEMNRLKFEKERRVKLFLGSSDERLAEMMHDLVSPATIWLDAHYSEGDTAKGQEMTPLLKELAVIKTHPMKNHAILIDDVRCFSKPEFDGIRESDAQLLIKDINPSYSFFYADGFAANDILVAMVEGPKRKYKSIRRID
jgi:hypothetical protein